MSELIAREQEKGSKIKAMCGPESVSQLLKLNGSTKAKTNL